MLAFHDKLGFDGTWEGRMPILQDKIVLVTGAGAGIGRAIALAMAEAGRECGECGGC